MTIHLLALIRKIDVILQNWSKLGLSLLGKIKILKMAIVSNINHISIRSNMLSLSLPRNALLKYNEVVYNFLWAGKKKQHLNGTKFMPP